ncbi:hypothetical protein [Devosia sp. DBB001]|nr:hypothetical protein [Devosia sp. DBB001]
MLRWKLIVAECAAKYGVSVKDILSMRRNKDIVSARYEAMWRMRQETTMSYPQIGAKLGRDHSTVVHAIKRHERIRGGAL